MKKKIWKKILKKKIEKIGIFFSLDFFSILKGPKSGKEKNRKSGIRTFQNLPDFRTGRDVRLSPTKRSLELKVRFHWILFWIKVDGFQLVEDAWIPDFF